MYFVEWTWTPYPGRECGWEIGVLCLVVQSFSRFRHYVDGSANCFGNKACCTFSNAFEKATHAILLCSLDRFCENTSNSTEDAGTSACKSFDNTISDILRLVFIVIKVFSLNELIVKAQSQRSFAYAVPNLRHGSNRGHQRVCEKRLWALSEAISCLEDRPIFHPLVRLDEEVCDSCSHIADVARRVPKKITRA